MKLYFASGSDHKRRELAEILKPHTLVMPKEAGVDFDFEEGETDFLSNALGKAMALYRLVKKPVIADDSGLCVHALGGEPGVKSARYGSKPGEPTIPDSAKIDLLLKNLSPYSDRSAFFVCAMAMVFDEHRVFTVQEIVRGRIAHAPAGDGGFGYDPVFLVEDSDRTMAELTETEKNTVSHRARAAQAIKRLLIPE